jgi:hypothetical protein
MNTEAEPAPMGVPVQSALSKSRIWRPLMAALDGKSEPRITGVVLIDGDPGVKLTGPAGIPYNTGKPVGEGEGATVFTGLGFGEGRVNFF